MSLLILGSVIFLFGLMLTVKGVYLGSAYRRMGRMYWLDLVLAGISGLVTVIGILMVMAGIFKLVT